MYLLANKFVTREYIFSDLIFWILYLCNVLCSWSKVARNEAIVSVGGLLSIYCKGWFHFLLWTRTRGHKTYICIKRSRVQIVPILVVHFSFKKEDLVDISIGQVFLTSSHLHCRTEFVVMKKRNIYVKYDSPENMVSLFVW